MSSAPQLVSQPQRSRSELRAPTAGNPSNYRCLYLGRHVAGSKCWKGHLSISRIKTVSLRSLVGTADSLRPPTLLSLFSSCHLKHSLPPPGPPTESGTGGISTAFVAKSHRAMAWSLGQCQANESPVTACLKRHAVHGPCTA